jgi:hypothetical protein
MTIRKLISPAPAPQNKLSQRPLKTTARDRRLDEENRKLKQKLAEQGRQHADERHAQQVETVVLLHAKNRNLDSKQVTQLVAVVEGQRKAWLRKEENAGRVFPAYESLKVELAKITGGPLPSRPMNSEPLPPPVYARAVPPATESERAAREAETTRQRDLSLKFNEQRQRDRDAFRDSLRKHGLQDPTLGFASGSGSTGYGT